jgi:hypothetical protein
MKVVRVVVVSNFTHMRQLAPMLILAMTILSVEGYSQKIFERKSKEIFPTNGKFKQGGFYIAPGITYPLGPFEEQEKELFNANDTSYLATLEGNGNIGLYLEVGWFHAMKDPVILDYIDFGLSYKQLKGKESFNSELSTNDVLLGSYEGEGTFSDSYLTGHVNANKLIQTGDYNFIQFSVGANIDYRLSESREGGIHPVPTEQEFPPSLLAQAHLKLGYGFKVNERFMVIPMIESPVFSVQPADQGLGDLQWFNTLYRPFIFSVRFLWLRYPNGFDCPEVESGGSGKRRKQKPYKPNTYHPE